MIQIRSNSPLGAILITDHHNASSAKFEMTARLRAGHTSIEEIATQERSEDCTEAALQHGPRRAQWAKSQKTTETMRKMSFK